LLLPVDPILALKIFRAMCLLIKPSDHADKKKQSQSK